MYTQLKSSDEFTINAGMLVSLMQLIGGYSFDVGVLREKTGIDNHMYSKLRDEHIRGLIEAGTGYTVDDSCF